MKVSKSQALLFMYELLLCNGSFTKEEVMSELEITNLTFLRYIQELKAYFSNFCYENVLFYDRSENMYFLFKRS